MPATARYRITSIQKYLGHKRLNTTMVYARVLDQTMADDYFKAMEKIEQQLTLPAAMLSQPVSTSLMLDLVNQLLGTVLDTQQHGIASSLYESLFRLVGQEKLDNSKINKVWT